MLKQFSVLLATVALACGAIGCGNQNVATESASKPEATPATEAAYKVETEPEGAVPVGEARQSAKDTEEVVLVGRIGGSMKPFIDGVAAFTIVDPKVPHCSEEEGCPTPWDYCCEQNAVKDNIAVVKIVDANGKPVEKDARELLGVKELNTVVVRGVAKRDDAGNLSVQANEVFVKE